MITEQNKENHIFFYKIFHIENNYRRTIVAVILSNNYCILAFFYLAFFYQKLNN